MNPGIRRNQYLDIGVDNIEEVRRISLLAKVLQKSVLSGLTGRHEYKLASMCRRKFTPFRKKGKMETLRTSHVYNPDAETYKRNGV